LLLEQNVHRFANGDAADTVRLPKLVFGREAIAGRVSPFQNLAC
jgi:hypothetical protein